MSITIVLKVAIVQTTNGMSNNSCFTRSRSCDKTGMSMVDVRPVYIVQKVTSMSTVIVLPVAPVWTEIGMSMVIVLPAVTV